jgi:CRISPR-associated exonuclease Cas4
MEEFAVSGTYIWYYCICKREVWLMAHSIESNQDDDNIRLGNFIHENTYLRNEKEVQFGNSKFDIMKSSKGELIIGEIKKSSSYLQSSKMQLLFYLWQLHKCDIKATGELYFPEEKKKEKVVLTQEKISELEKVESEILDIVKLEKPPLLTKNKYCKSCAYSEFCWS